MVSASCATAGFWTCRLGARPGASWRWVAQPERPSSAPRASSRLIAVWTVADVVVMAVCMRIPPAESRWSSGGLRDTADAGVGQGRPARWANGGEAGTPGRRLDDSGRDQFTAIEELP